MLYLVPTTVVILVKFTVKSHEDINEPFDNPKHCVGWC